MTQLEIPWDSLSTTALLGVIEEFVTREGTEYGASEVSLDCKCRQILEQLQAGQARITFDDVKHSCSIVPVVDKES